MKAWTEVGGGARICFEAIGDRSAPALLLIAGAASSMDWWDDELCRRLADGGRLVVRYDFRDTGESTAYPAGSPGYDAKDMEADAVAVLDALGIGRAHLVGISMGGGIALELALDQRDRVATLTLMSTSSVGPGRDGLPGMSPELEAVFADASPEPDWNDRDAVVEHIVEGERPFAGSGDFDPERTRAVARRVVERSVDIAASQTNHWLLEDGGEPIRPRLGELEGVPALVLHGTADPLFPLAHGRALAAEIPGARLIQLDGVGHQFPPPRTWDVVVDALLTHTG